MMGFEEILQMVIDDNKKVDDIIKQELAYLDERVRLNVIAVMGSIQGGIARHREYCRDPKCTDFAEFYAIGFIQQLSARLFATLKEELNVDLYNVPDRSGFEGEIGSNSLN
jgi:hypothetical protein